MSQLDNILQQRLTRKQFILVLLSGVVSLFGITALLGALTKGTQSSHNMPGYGRGQFGP